MNNVAIRSHSFFSQAPDNPQAVGRQSNMTQQQIIAGKRQPLSACHGLQGFWVGHVFHTLSLRYFKAPLVELPTSDGIPRYFSFSDSLWTFRIPMISSRTLFWQLLAKRIEDLSNNQSFLMILIRCKR